MKCAHLFNGIGGFALAAHWMGWQNYMHCEIDSFCNRVMNFHFPKSIQHEDIKKTDFNQYRGTIDILTGGFPCQPYSQSGKRLGKEDERHLWPENFRAVREIQPRWVVGENVRGLTNWNGGLVFDEVQADLETAGYEVTPFLLPAASVNAPHRRDRIWFVGFSERITSNTSIIRCNRNISTREVLQRKEQTCGEVGSGNSKEGINTNSSNPGIKNLRSGEGKIYESEIASDTQGIAERKQANKINPFTETGQAWIESLRSYERTDWRNFPTQSPLRSGDDGVSSELDGITFSAWCEESIKAAGNAIVPQVALQIFKAIEQYEKL